MEYHDWDEDGDFIDDWLQLNWELLVEREILEDRGFLTQFSMTHLSKRITFNMSTQQYAIIARSNQELLDKRTKKQIPFEKKLRLFSFRTYRDNSFGLYPPFDLACLVMDSTNELYTTEFFNLRFYLVKQ
jgi:hypothetical protein